MTVTELETPLTRTRWRSDAERREAAIAAYRESYLRGQPYKPKDLAMDFGMSDSWGRDIVRHAKRGLPRVVETATPEPEPVETATVVDATPVETTGVPRDPVRVVLSYIAGFMAGVMSYGHLYEVALASGENVWLARAFPLSIDVLAVAAYRAGHKGWLFVAVVFSIVGNVASRFPEVVVGFGWLVSAVPVVMAYGAHSLIHTERKES